MSQIPKHLLSIIEFLDSCIKSGREHANHYAIVKVQNNAK